MDNEYRDKWRKQLLKVETEISQVEYTLRLKKEVQKRLYDIAAEILEKCSKCGCGKIATYETIAENGAHFRYCIDHTPTPNKEK